MNKNNIDINQATKEIEIFLETLEDIDHVYLLEKEDNWINDAIND